MMMEGETSSFDRAQSGARDSLRAGEYTTILYLPIGPNEISPAQADGVVDGKYEMPRLVGKTPNHPALRAPLQGRGIRNPTIPPNPANSPGSSLLGLRDAAIHTDVRVASAL
jgi:hypothetical protein